MKSIYDDAELFGIQSEKKEELNYQQNTQNTKSIYNDASGMNMQKVENKTTTTEPKKTALDKLESVSKFGTNITGANAAAKLTSPILTTLARLFSEPFGKKGEEFRQKLDINSSKNDTLVKKYETEGASALLKDVSGSSLELAGALTPYVTPGGITSNIANTIKGTKPFTSVASKFPNLSRYANYGLRGGTYGATFSAGKSLQDNKDIGGIIDDTIKGFRNGALWGVAIPLAIEGTVRAVKNISSLYSGIPKDALENAFKNPEKVNKALNEYKRDPENVKVLLNKADDSFKQIKKARTDNYRANLQALNDDIFVTKTGDNAGRLYIKDPKTGVFKPTKLTTQGIKSEYTKTLQDFNIKVLPEHEQTKIAELKNLIDTWDDFTPLGLNDLKRAIINRTGNTNSKELNAITQRLASNVRNYVNTRVPQIKVMNEQYTTDSAFIEKLQQDIFGRNSRMSDTAKINKLLSIFNEKTDLRRKLVEQLGKKTSVDLLNEINGAVLTQWLPQNWVQRFVLAGGGLSAGIFASPATALSFGATLPLMSPRISGKTSVFAGKLNNMMGQTSQQIGSPILTKILTGNTKQEKIK